MKPVLLIVTSKSCGACTNFKKRQLPELEKELKTDDRITIETLDYPDFNVSAELKPYIKFFPSIMLIPGNLWNTKKLKGIVKHGDEDMSKLKIDYSVNSIKKWIDETLKNEMFQSSLPERLNGPLTRPLEDGRYVVPTYGTFKKFKSMPPDEDS